MQAQSHSAGFRKANTFSYGTAKYLQTLDSSLGSTVGEWILKLSGMSFDWGFVYTAQQGKLIREAAGLPEHTG